MLCDTSGWGSFNITYEGCQVLNIAGLVNVRKQGYVGSWWEWDCGKREGREIIVEIRDREPSSTVVGKKRKSNVSREVAGTEMSKNQGDTEMEMDITA